MIKKNKVFFSFCFVFLFSRISSAQTQSSVNEPVQQLIQIAKEKKVADQRGWLKLLHFEPNAYFVTRSQIVDTSFFFSADGYKDAQAELDATIKAFFLPIDSFLDKKEIKKTDHSRHPICRFPARLQFLKTELPNAAAWALLPKPECGYYQIYYEALAPHSVSFIFSSFYPDSPGSAFGHTLFRINKNDKKNVNNQELLDHGIGYAANITTSNPLIYAVMGILGGFTGTWSNLPYYYKVREYNDFEARDLWSYELDLSQYEVNMLVMHLWEIGAHNFTYYFFTQNCAFHMLTSLEAAAPRLYLSDKIPSLYVIPSDALKALFETPGLVKDINYRPSIRRTFISRYELLTDTNKDLFKQYAKMQMIPTEVEKESPQQKANFLDTAIDLHNLINPANITDPADARYKTKQKLLSARAHVDYVSQPLQIPIIPEQQPEKSHSSTRVGLSANSDKQLFLDYRFALHDLLDQNTGLPKNSQLEFGYLSAVITKDHVRMNDFIFFRVLNMNPVSFYAQKLSWGIEIGMTNLDYCSNSSNCAATGAAFKAGYASDVGPFVTWAMGRGSARYGAELDHSVTYAAIGYELGLLYNIHPKHALLATYLQDYPDARSSNELLSVQYRYHLAKDFELSAFGKKNLSKSTGGVGAYLFF
ncbi:MAG: DUF4105 domain-containing protein [Bdellovibrio sp.]|nr:DUF4105 domain-containing protein [Bdellovibrio sp.]